MNVNKARENRQKIGSPFSPSIDLAYHIDCAYNITNHHPLYSSHKTLVNNKNKEDENLRGIKKKMDIACLHWKLMIATTSHIKETLYSTYKDKEEKKQQKGLNNKRILVENLVGFCNRSPSFALKWKCYYLVFPNNREWTYPFKSTNHAIGAFKRTRIPWKNGEKVDFDQPHTHTQTHKTIVNEIWL